MSILPFPAKQDEQLHHLASAHVWQGADKLFSPYRVYLTSHRLLGLDRNGHIVFNHLFRDIEKLAVARDPGREPGLRVELKNGSFLHLACLDDRQEDSASTATRWVTLIRDHMLDLDG